MSNNGTATKNATCNNEQGVNILVYGLNSASLENVKNVVVNTFFIEEIQAGKLLLSYFGNQHLLVLHLSDVVTIRM